MRSITFTYILLSIFACKARPQSSNVLTIPKIVVDKLGENIESFPNQSGKFILFVQKASNNQPTHLVKAMVIETASNKVVVEEAFVPGYIKWASESTLELLSIPGIIKANQDLSDYKRIIRIQAPKSDL
jgi:hypothetical protein